MKGHGYSMGTTKDITNYDILYGVIGKTIPSVGRITARPYIGKSKVLVDAKGEKEKYRLHGGHR